MHPRIRPCIPPRVVALGGLLCLGCTATPEPPPAQGALRGDALGTTWSVRWGPTERVGADAVESVVVEALTQVDARMSTWKSDSELSLARASSTPVVVSEETLEVVDAAVALAEATQGAFDPTVLPLVEFWGLHGTPRTTWPTTEEIEAVKASTGWRKVATLHHVTLDGAGTPTTSAILDVGGTALDLSAIAKGHAVDRILRGIASLGASDVFVEVGGEVATTGHRVNGEPWRVGVERPVVGSNPADGLAATVSLTTGAVATSGNYRNRYLIEGREVHHTLDPRTGSPALSRTASATVLAPDCRTADGWATALMVLGESGLSLIEARPDLEAWLILEDGRTVGSSGADERVEVTASVN